MIKMLGRFLNEKILKSEFSKNALTLISGNAFAQLLPFLFAPVLSRIYSPEEFGRLALYIAFVQIFGSIAGGRYELAILLPKERKVAVQTTFLSMAVVLGFSIVFFLIIAFFSQEIANIIGDGGMASWLFFVPFSILMIGIFNSLSNFNLREKEFKNIAKGNIFKASGSGVLQLGLGATRIVSGGLLIGQIMSHFFGNFKLSKTLLSHKEEIRSVNFEELRKLANRYIDFPKYSVVGILLNNLSSNLVNFFVSSLYTVSTVGFYSHAFRYLGSPINLVANSIGQVYVQRMAELNENKEKSIEEFKKAALRLTAIGFIIFVPLFFMVEPIFELVFGKEWAVAGKFAKILTPLFFVRFVVSPLSYVLIVMEKQGKELLVHFIIMIASIGVWLFVYFKNLDVRTAILTYSSVLSLVYVLVFIYIFSLLKTK